MLDGEVLGEGKVRDILVHAVVIHVSVTVAAAAAAIVRHSGGG